MVAVFLKTLITNSCVVDILYILKDKVLPIKGVPRKAEFIQQNRTEQWHHKNFIIVYVFIILLI